MNRTWSALPGTGLSITDLATLDPARIGDMREAGAEVRECLRVLKKGGLNIVGEILRGQGEFYELDHYPDGDVIDPDTGAQFYYHAHRGLAGEHGHFHAFVGPDAVPDGVVPVSDPNASAWPSGADTSIHLAALSMDRFGFPIGFFATNRWVTDETWFACDDVVTMLDGFSIDHAWPSWPTNRWIGAMYRMFRPEVEALLRHRDNVIAGWRETHPSRDAFEDRDLEVTGHIRIYLNERLEALLGKDTGPTGR